MGVKEKIQGRSYQMSKGTEMVNTEGAENVPPGIGFPVGVAREAWALQAFRGEVKAFIFSPHAVG